MAHQPPRGIEDARGALARLRRALGPEPLDQHGPLDEPTIDAFTAAMDADFNTPDALAVIFDLARQINTSRTAEQPRAETDRLRRTLVKLLDVLGLDLGAAPAQDEVPIEPFVALLEYIHTQVDLVDSNGAAATQTPALEQVVDKLLDSRRSLRAAKQFALADEVRVRLKDLGVIVEDKPGGESIWRIER